jgi:mercuric ion transport protein
MRRFLSMTSKSTWTTAAGAVGGAVLASACCIGPVVIAALGLGSAGFATALGPYRPYLLGLTGLLLAGAYYLTYRRRPAACGPDGVCHAAGNSRRQKFLLWVVTAVVVAVGTYPSWGGRSGSVPQVVASSTDQLPQVVEFAVTGMTCIACARQVESALVKVPGVQHAAVSYEGGTVRVSLARAVPAQDLIRAVGKTGYKASVPNAKTGAATSESPSDAAPDGGK